MKLVVIYEDGVWDIELTSTGDEDSYADALELTDFEDVEEVMGELLQKMAEHADPIGHLFDELDR